MVCPSGIITDYTKNAQGELDKESRCKFTEEMIQRIPARVAPPEGFNTMTATSAELTKYGFPPRSNEKAHPNLKKVWKQIVSGKIHYVEPKLKVNNQFHPPIKRAHGVERNIANSAWSGAVFTLDPSQSQRFFTNAAFWIVPDIAPPITAQVDNGWQDGTYQTVVWVGIDGWGTDSLLGTGTASVCVVSEGQITSKQFYPWFEWYPGQEVEYGGLAISSGDLVVASGGYNAVGDFFVEVTNVTTSQYSQVSLPSQQAPSGNPIEGLSAQMIVSDPVETSTGTPFPFANYGATYFSNISIESGPNMNQNEAQSYDFTSATLVNLVINAAEGPMSIPRIENSGLLSVYGLE